MKQMAAWIPVVLLICGITANADAQVRFGLGLRTGLNFSTMSMDPDPVQQIQGLSQEGRTIFTIGTAAEMEFARMFAAEMGVIYVGKGAKFTVQTTTWTVKWSELDIPILFKVKFLPGRIRPYAFVGPNLGFVLSAGSTIENPPNPPQEIDYKAGSTNTLSAGSFDFALDFGAGAEFMAMRNLGIFLDLRYSLGLSNLVSPSAAQPQTTISWKTSGFQAQVGSFYYF